MMTSETNNRKQILICTPSNYAIDEIIIRIIEKGLQTRGGQLLHPKIIRMGVMDKIKHSKVRDCCLSVLAENELKSLKIDSIYNKEQDHYVNIHEQIRELTTQIDRLRIMLKGKPSQEIRNLLDKKHLLIEQVVHRKSQKLEKKKNLEEIEERLIRTADIICCTLNSSGSEKLDRIEHNLEAIIIDEAA